MRRVNKAKFFSVIVVWGISLAFLSHALKQALEIGPDSSVNFLVSGVVVGGGIMGGISFLKWLVGRGKFKWVEEK